MIPHTGLKEAGVLGALFVLLWFAPAMASDYALQIAFRIMIFLTLAESWNLLTGLVGLVSLGTSSSVGLGAYVAFGLLNRWSLPLPVTLAICALSGALLATLVSPALFRLRGVYFTVGTLALASLMQLLMVNLPTFGGATGIFLKKDPPPLAALYHIALVVALMTSLAITASTRSRLSVAMRAVRDDEDAAAQMGVRPFRVKLGAFALASALIAMAGGVQAINLGVIEPYGAFGLQWSIDALSMVIIGGVGLRAGPLVGVVLVVALGEALANYPEVHIAITGVILIILIRFDPRVW